MSANKLYEFTAKISRGEGSDLPDGMTSAFVNCYSAGISYEVAVRQGVLVMAQRGYVFQDLVQQVRELAPGDWCEYVQKAWPEFVEDLPSQADIVKITKEGGVLFGPFIAF